MSLTRKIKRNKLKKIIGKCKKCENAYKESHRQLCTECHRSKKYIHFKRRKY